MGWREKLRNSRERIGLSQEELGDRVGVSGQAINLWENGPSYPSVKNLLIAVEKCGFDLAWIFGPGPDEPPTDDERAARAAFDAKMRAEGPRAVFELLVTGTRLRTVTIERVVEHDQVERPGPVVFRDRRAAETHLRELPPPRPPRRGRPGKAAPPASEEDLQGQQERPEPK